MLCALLGTVAPCYAQDTMDSIHCDRFSLYYSKDDVTVQENYMGNHIQMARIKNILANSQRIDSIAIYAYASPDGARHRNEWLAQERAISAKDFILANLPNDSILLPHNIILRPMGENWEGLHKELEAHYLLPNRDKVMEIMLANVSVDTKKIRLQQLDGGKTFNYIVQNHMPALRLATWICVYSPTMQFANDTTFTQARMACIDVPPIDTLPAPFISVPKAPQKSLKWALKTNMLYDAALIPNLGTEFYLGGNMSISANWHYAWWNTKSWFWRTYGGEVALRMWLGKQARKKFLSGHHIGLYGQLLTYDFLVGKTGYMSADPHETLFDRPQYAFGLEYGYSLPITKCLNIDFGIGVGYMKGVYNEYRYIDDCYVWQQRVNRKFIGPTKAEISLVWRLDWNTTKKGGRR